MRGCTLMPFVWRSLKSCADSQVNGAFTVLKKSLNLIQKSLYWTIGFLDKGRGAPTCSRRPLNSTGSIR